jgi:hypothetical protein
MNELGLAYFYVGQPDKALATLANAWIDFYTVD